MIFVLILLLLLINPIVDAGAVVGTSVALICCSGQWWYALFMVPGCVAICMTPLPPVPNPFDPAMVCQTLTWVGTVTNPV
jgi:hypothetical protein